MVPSLAERGEHHALSAASYLGGFRSHRSALTSLDAIARDPAGNFLVAGSSRAIGIATDGAPQQSLAGEKDPILAKFDAEGRLLWATYWGSDEGDYGQDVAVDAAGNAYMTGWTFADFPTTPGGTAGTCDVEEQNSYVAKFSPEGQVLYSTCIDVERAYAIEVDGAGSAYITGDSTPEDLSGDNLIGPGGTFDAFVVKLTPDGSAVERSTWIGGSDLEGASDIQLDDSGAAYVTGVTYSRRDWPVTDPEDEISGRMDSFVFKLAPAGDELEYSTFLGGRKRTEATGLTLGSDGTIYATGAISKVLPRGLYVHAIGPEGDLILGYERFGDADLGPGGIEFTPRETLLIAGGSDSGGLWLTDPVQSKKGGGFDGFIVELDPDGMEEVFSTYLGGRDADHLSDAVMTDEGTMFFVGATHSPDMPTLNPHQRSLVGKTDGFYGIVSRTDSDCTMEGSSGRDTMTGTIRADVMCGRGGNDVLRGSDLGDELRGGAGDDRLRGGRGRDVAKGGRGNDVCDAERRRSC
ncbi:MAG: SBBP repeat-containing protein [Actinomycetota bacterium]